METSLSVQNDAILKKAKRWIVSSLVAALIVGICSSICWNFLYSVMYENYGMNAINTVDIIDTVTSWLWPILIIVGCVILLKHSVSSIRIFAKMLIVYQGWILLYCAIILLMNQLNLWEQMDTIVRTWWSIGQYILSLCFTFIIVMGLSALWKNKQIRTNYANIISMLILVLFVGIVLNVPGNIWHLKGCFENPTVGFWEIKSFTIDGKVSQVLGSISRIGSPILSILEIYCYCKLLKTPSLMPTEDNPDELPYSYRLTKIEFGFVVCVLLFIGLSCLSFLFV